MNRSFVAQQQMLPTSQAAFWIRLAPAARLGFVLYVGTAIALRLGHRTSADLLTTRLGE